MTLTELWTFIKDGGGWVAFIVFFLYEKVWPLIADKIIPAKLKESQDKLSAQIDQAEEGRNAMIQMTQDLREERAQQYREDQKFRQEIERDRLAAAKETTEAIKATNMAIQELARSNIQTNERLEQIMRNQTVIMDRQDDILKTLNDAINRMTETVARREGYDKGKKEHKPGDTGPLSDDAKKET